MAKDAEIDDGDIAAAISKQFKPNSKEVQGEKGKIYCMRS